MLGCHRAVHRIEKSHHPMFMTAWVLAMVYGPGLSAGRGAGRSVIDIGLDGSDEPRQTVLVIESSTVIMGRPAGSAPVARAAPWDSLGGPSTVLTAIGN